MHAPWTNLLAASAALALSCGGEVQPSAPANTVLVAAIQYVGGEAKKVDRSCRSDDDSCAVEVLVRRARERGAALVVTPEYGLDQNDPEPAPAVGDTPREPTDKPLATRFSALAAELGIYLVIDLETWTGDQRRNTQLAFDPEGVVVGVHHKFELYESERSTHVAGSEVTAFDTPFGRVGMLICADLYGDPRLHDELTGELGARIVAYSTMWTVAEATRWQAAFARDWGVYLVAANGSRGAGRGGGVFSPGGEALARSDTREAQITFAAIPRPSP